MKFEAIFSISNFTSSFDKEGTVLQALNEMFYLMIEIRGCTNGVHFSRITCTVQVGRCLSFRKTSSNNTESLCRLQESIGKRKLSFFIYGFTTLIKKFLYSFGDNMPGFNDVILTSVYFFIYSSTNFSTLDPNDPVVSCRILQIIKNMCIFHKN